MRMQSNEKKGEFLINIWHYFVQNFVSPLSLCAFLISICRRWKWFSRSRSPMLLQLDERGFVGHRRRDRAAVQILWRVWRIWRVHDSRMWSAGRPLVRAPQVCEVKRVWAYWCHLFDTLVRAATNAVADSQSLEPRISLLFVCCSRNRFGHSHDISFRPSVLRLASFTPTDRAHLRAAIFEFRLCWAPFVLCESAPWLPITSRSKNQKKRSLLEPEQQNRTERRNERNSNTSWSRVKLLMLCRYLLRSNSVRCLF